jgi:hypothetical protein
MFTYAYSITSEATSQFACRQSYVSNGTPVTTFLHTIIGGGNRDSEFALKYRMFEPADTTVCDSMWMFDQVFGPNYSEGTGVGYRLLRVSERRTDFPVRSAAVGDASDSVGMIAPFDVG